MRLQDSLLLFRYITDLLGGDFQSLRDGLREADAGRRADGQSHYFSVLESRASRLRLDLDALRRYDLNILGYEARLARYRSDFSLKFFQYLATLYVEVYLDRLSADRTGLAMALEGLRARTYPHLPPIRSADLSKLALWMATGSGKTLLMHVNLLQFERYRPFEPVNVLLLTPSPALAEQHLSELEASGIPACHARDACAGHRGVQVLEITKLYVPKGEAAGPRSGESLPADHFEGPNLILVDEGHKGSATRSDAETERTWRTVREALADNGGFTLEYSATFAQVTEDDEGLFNEYARAILFDYAYRHFHADGFGKDYWVANLHDQDDRLYGETLLMGGLLAFYEQRRYFDEAYAELHAYRLARPLMVFVGDKVTAGSAPEVLQVIQFLDRVTRERAWAENLIARLLAGESGLVGQDGSDVFTRGFSYLKPLRLPPSILYGDLCKRLFHGMGRLSLHLLRKADGEIGIRTAESAADAYFGVINVGDAPAFVKRVGEQTAISTSEDDALSESLFKHIDQADSAISFLVGSKKFIEGWSSWRVSTMGLLKVGRSAGAQVLQLFGRGVRLQGSGLSMRRSESLPGAHPAHIRLVETLNIFGLRANYLQTFLETLRREDAEPPVLMTLPIEVQPGLGRVGLRYPAVDPGFRFSDLMLRFDPKGIRVSLSLVPRTGVGSAQGYELGAVHASPQPLPERTLALLPFEALYQHAVEHKTRKGWSHLYVPRAAIRVFFEAGARLAAPPEVLAPVYPRHYEVLETAARIMVEKAIDQFYFRRRSEVETSYSQLSLFDDTSPNFPRVEEARAYQLKVPPGLVEQVQAIIRDKEKLLKEDAGQPLPRLHVEMHLYAPVLLSETPGSGGTAGEAAQVQSVPTGLKESEVRFVRDLCEFWRGAREQATWRDCSVYLIRNLPKQGIGFFQTAGFYPDFLLWLKRGDQQALAFLEPHGVTRMESEKIELMKLIRTELAQRVGQPLAGWVVAPTPIDQIKWISGDPNEKQRKLKNQHVLLQQEPDYIAELMEELRVMAS